MCTGICSNVDLYTATEVVVFASKSPVMLGLFRLVPTTPDAVFQRSMNVVLLTVDAIQQDNLAFDAGLYTHTLTDLHIHSQPSFILTEVRHQRKLTGGRIANLLG